MLNKHRIEREKWKDKKLDPTLLQWSPHLTSSAVELEESRLENEVFLLFSEI